MPPLSLRVSLNERCQLRCRYCRPAHAVLPPPGADRPPEDWLRRLTLLAAAVPLERVRLTGGEPLLYSELLPLVEGCARAGLPDLALTTNGFRLAAAAQALRDAGLRRVNISLDSLDPKRFRLMTGAGPGPVLAAVEAAVAAGLAVKLNAVILRGLNDEDLPALLGYAAERGVEIRFLELMPIGPAGAEFERLFVSGREMKERLAEGVRLAPLPYEPGATSRDFVATLADGRQVRCGFILPTSEPFCNGCRRLRLAADGTVMGCLAQPERLAMDTAMAAAERGDPEPLRALVRGALSAKERGRDFRSQTAMVRVGG